MIKRIKNWIGKRSKWQKVLMVLILAVVVWQGYKTFVKGKQTTTQYQTSQAENGTLIVTVSGSGQVTTTNSASVTTQVTGVVKNVYVKDGDQVKMGQKIAVIEPDQVGAQKADAAFASYQSAKNNLKNAQNTIYSLQSKLFAANQKFINDAVARNLATNDPTYIQQNADWLSAEAGYKDQQNIISQAQTSLSSAWLSYIQSSPIISAPISGKISGFSLMNGTVISGTDTKIANVSTDAFPTISLNLTEIDIPKVQVGQKVTVLFDSFPDTTFTGKVVSVDRVGALSSGVTTYPAIIVLDSKDEGILPNMAATANIITKVKTNVILVPTAAVITQNGQNMVRVLTNGQVSTVPVETGDSNDSQTEITSGVTAGQTVVTSVTNGATSTRSGSSSPFSVFGGGGGAVRFAR